jgi:hypothetical protein
MDGKTGKQFFTLSIIHGHLQQQVLQCKNFSNYNWTLRVVIIQVQILLALLSAVKRVVQYVI